MSPASLIPSRQTHELVVNWHITEACNYGCRYCFAKWQTPGTIRELIHDSVGTVALLQELFRFFHPDNLRNPLRQEMAWTSLRLNLAGGEPLLYDSEVVQTVKLAREIGFDVSLISNGSRLTCALMAQLAQHLTMLGLSLDSTDERTNQAIGRADRHSSVLDLRQASEAIALGRRINPALRLKINTVVNALNWRCDMTQIIRKLAPDKWKVLRMLPTVTDHLTVSESEFTAFVQHHKDLDHLMLAEDNGDMAESYIMLDPHGRFFQNALGRTGYDYSAPIRDVGVAAAFAQIRVSARKFCSRYPKDLAGRRA